MTQKAMPKMFAISCPSRNIETIAWKMSNLMSFYSWFKQQMSGKFSNQHVTFDFSLIYQKLMENYKKEHKFE